MLPVGSAGGMAEKEENESPALGYREALLENGNELG